MSRTFGMIKSGAMWRGAHMDILAHARAWGFEVTHLEERRLHPQEIAELYSEHAHSPYYPGLVRSVSGPVALMILEWDERTIERGHKDAAAHWRALIGPTDPVQARDPKGGKHWTIRARHGRELPDNAVHGSADAEAAEREIAIFWPNGIPSKIESQDSIVRWATETFGGGDSDFLLCGRAVTELGELMGAIAQGDRTAIASEAADVAIVTCRLADRYGVTFFPRRGVEPLGHEGECTASAAAGMLDAFSGLAHWIANPNLLATFLKHTSEDLHRVALLGDFDLHAAINDKMAINRMRKWKRVPGKAFSQKATV